MVNTVSQTILLHKSVLKHINSLTFILDHTLKTVIIPVLTVQRQQYVVHKIMRCTLLILFHLLIQLLTLNSLENAV